MKRAVAVVLALAVMLTTAGAGLREPEASGTAGKVRWAIKDGTLIIAGAGPIEDYEYGCAPWYEFAGGIWKIVIRNGVTRIGDYAFCDILFFESIQIPKSVKSIGTSAFKDCMYLQEISIPDGVETIGDNAFAGCLYLETVAIPQSVTEIGTNAFDGCGSMRAITVAKKNSAYSSVDGVLFSRDKTELLCYPPSGRQRRTGCWKA